jgi:hypothetical protein
VTFQKAFIELQIGQRIQDSVVTASSVEQGWARADVPQLMALSRAYVDHRTLAQFAYDCAKRVESKMGEHGKAALELVRQRLVGEPVSTEALQVAEAAAVWATALAAAWAAVSRPTELAASAEKRWQADHYRALVRCPTEDEVIATATEKRLAG